MDEDLIALGADDVQRADHAAQDAVLVADALPGEAGDAVSRLMPFDDGIEVLVPGAVVAEGGVLGPLDDVLNDRGDGGEVHVRHPHRDGVEALPGGSRGAEGHAGIQGVDCHGVFAVAVDDGGKIVLHGVFPSFSKNMVPVENSVPALLYQVFGGMQGFSAAAEGSAPRTSAGQRHIPASAGAE